MTIQEAKQELRQAFHDAQEAQRKMTEACDDAMVRSPRVDIAKESLANLLMKLSEVAQKVSQLENVIATKLDFAAEGISKIADRLED